MAEVTRVLLWKGIIGPEVTLDLSVNGRLVAFHNLRHLPDRNLRVPPILDLPTFFQAQLRVSGPHGTIS